MEVVSGVGRIHYPREVRGKERVGLLVVLLPEYAGGKIEAISGELCIVLVQCGACSVSNMSVLRMLLTLLSGGFSQFSSPLQLCYRRERLLSTILPSPPSPSPPLPSPPLALLPSLPSHPLPIIFTWCLLVGGWVSGWGWYRGALRGRRGVGE